MNYINRKTTNIQVVKNIIKEILIHVIRFITNTRIGSFVDQIIINDVMSRVKTVRHNGITLKLSVPNSLNRYRAKSFSVKEPETLQWIDEIPSGLNLWDIGANLGKRGIIFISILLFVYQ